MLKENILNEIISFKLGTGEEIIGKVIGNDEGSYELNRPVVLAMAPDGGIRLIPWLMSTNVDDVMLNKSNIIGHAVTSKDIANKYTESVSDIQIVK